MGPEEKAVAKTLRELRALGGWWQKNPRTRFGKAGLPDIYGVINGEFIAIEVKRFDGKGSYGVTCTQERTLRDIRNAGGIAWVIDSEEVLAQSLAVLGATRHFKDPKGRPAQAEREASVA